jgi:hypothetical protein
MVFLIHTENITITATANNDGAAAVPAHIMKSHMDMHSPLNLCMRWSFKLHATTAVPPGKEAIIPSE